MVVELSFILIFPYPVSDKTLSRITKAREMVELFQRYQKSHNHSEVEPYSAPSPLSPSATEDPGKTEL